MFAPFEHWQIRRGETAILSPLRNVIVERFERQKNTKSMITFWAARVNYAWLLMRTGKPEEAIREFEAAKPLFVSEPDGSEYASYLAECYQQIGEYAKAQEAWEQSKALAEAAGDHAMALAAEVQSAKLLAKQKGYQHGDTVLKNLFRVSRGHDRLTVGRACVELAIEQGDLKQANRWATLLSKVSAKVGHSEDEIDAYMLFGDALWATAENRVEAIKYFVSGQLFSFELSPEAISRTGVHLVWKLFGVDQTVRDDYRERIQQWLRNQSGDNRSVGWVDVVLWPFRVAQQVGSLKGLPRQKAEQKVLTAIESVFSAI